MLHGATPAETCFATPLHTTFSENFQRVTAALTQSVFSHANDDVGLQVPPSHQGQGLVFTRSTAIYILQPEKLERPTKFRILYC